MRLAGITGKAKWVRTLGTPQDDLCLTSSLSANDRTLIAMSTNSPSIDVGTGPLMSADGGALLVQLGP